MVLASSSSSQAMLCQQGVSWQPALHGPRGLAAGARLRPAPQRPPLCRRQLVCSARQYNSDNTSQADTPASAGSTAQQCAAAPASSRPSQWQRFQGFVQAGDAKEAWLCISASTLKLTAPAVLLALLLHGSLWGGAPPAAVAAAEAAAYSGAAVAAATEVWKVLEGFQG